MDPKDEFEHYLAMVESDIKTAKLLLDSQHVLPCLVYCSLAIEKALKAAHYKVDGSIPKTGHSLNKLATNTYLKEKMDDALCDTLKDMENMHKNARYPSIDYAKVSFEKCKEVYRRAEVLKCWIINQIKMQI